MSKFILARLVQALPVLVLVSILTFAGLELVPGDPLLAVIGPAQDGTQLSPEDVERIREQFGLHGSLPERYVRYVEHVILHFDFGTSLQSQEPVTKVIADRLPVSLWLNGLALGLSIVLGLTLGLIAGVRPGTRGDLGVTFLAVVGVAAPSFWLAIGLIILFSVELGWLPTFGWVDPLSDPWNAAKHLAMPVFALSLGGVAVIATTDTIVRPGDTPTGLHRHRAGQGVDRQRGPLPPCAKELDAAGGHDHGPADRCPLRRQRDHRATLRAARPGPARV